MKTLFNFDETIKVPYENRGKRLVDIIPKEKYDEWFSLDNPKIFILNKGICGNGGTTGFIRYAKQNFCGLYCLVPNVSIVKSKEIDDSLCCVYGDATGYDITKPVRICTWDTGINVIDEWPDWGVYGDPVDISVWKNSCLVIDEYHKLVDDSSFREVCCKVLKLVIKTKLNVVLMSATPNYDIINYLKKYSGKEVVTVNIDYGEEKTSNVQINFIGNMKKHSKTNNVNNIVNKLCANRKDDEHICIFYNNVEKINNIIYKSIYIDEMECLCSSKKKDGDVANYSDKFDKTKHIHFMTSAYFTGHDIDVFADIILIIGGNDNHITAYTPNEMKQIQGRPRPGYGNMFVLKTAGGMNKEQISCFESDFRKNNKTIKELEKSGADMSDIDFMEYYVNAMYQKQKIKAMKGWENIDTFREMMSIFPEFFVIEGTVGDAGNAKKRKCLNHRQFVEKVLAGEDIDSLDYKYKNSCKKFIEKYGLQMFENTGINDIVRTIKLHEKSDGIDLDMLSSDELFDLFFGNGLFSWRYLEAVLNFLKYNKSGNLQIDVAKKFNCVCCPEIRGKTLTGNYIVFENQYNKRFQKMVKLRNTSCLSYIDDNSSVSPKFRTEITVSKVISAPGHKTQAITTDIFSTDIKTLASMGEPIRKLVCENKEQIKDVKDNDQYKAIFETCKKWQTKISEFYKKEHNGEKYGHLVSEMDHINSLIIDIDNSITFSQFCVSYAAYCFIAYPSISNTTDDWTKFRVIFPLQNELEIPNDNLQVLKFLRLSMCMHEDKNHQLAAYMNKEQWDMRYENNGDVITIKQDDVDYIYDYLHTLNDYRNARMNKSGKITGNDWTLEQAIEIYKSKYDFDDKRHTGTFIIKLHLSTDDRAKFRQWMVKNCPDKVHHFDSHKI